MLEKTLPLFVACSILVPSQFLPSQARKREQRSFHVSCFVETEQPGATFPALVTNKDWSSGTIKDYTTNHAYGSSRTSGALSGWALAVAPSGAWTFNIGDGKQRLDYRPTAKRQRVNDGRTHMLAFSLDRERKECRLYFDGTNVAIYSVAGLGNVEGDGKHRQTNGIEELSYSEGTTTDAAVAAAWSKHTDTRGTSNPRPTVESIRVLAWNIWHGGRRDGNEIGIEKTVDVIRKSGADIICMQETYGSGAAIADALGYFFYLRSTNLSVMSRFPMGRSFDRYQSFRLGGIEVEVSEDQKLDVFSLWINHLPSVASQMAEDDVTAAKLIAEDDKTRGREIRGILKTLRPHIEASKRIPLIVAGDFNSSSHLDWTEATAAKHKGLEVAWPVSSAMVATGFHDAFRTVHADPSRQVGRTWSPRFEDSMQRRIDYVYFMGEGLRATAAQMIDQHSNGWPSDHAAVLATFDLR